jgi:DNA-binding SARP family transcriptional activator
VVTTAVLLGAFCLTVDGRLVPETAFERPSGLRLLQLLLATPGHRIRREAAAELLWPELESERSGLSLRKALCFARHALEVAGLPAGAIAGTASLLELDPDRPIEIDLDQFRGAVDDVLGAAAMGRPVDPLALEILANLGGNDLLPDLPDEEWLLPLRERLHRESIEAYLAGARFARAMARPDLALRLVDRLLRLEPAEEAAHQLAIELHLRAGRLDAARRQLVACTAALADAYGIGPSAELQALVVAPSEPWTGADPAEAGIAAMLLATLGQALSSLAGNRPLSTSFAPALGTPGAGRD